MNFHFRRKEVKSYIMKGDFFIKYGEELKKLISGTDFSSAAHIAEAMLKACENGNNIFVFGNGGSGATASHFACDINKGVSYGRGKRFKVICLNDNMPSVLAYANDVDYSDIFVEQLKNFCNEGDLIIAFSGSGNSENVIKAAKYAISIGAYVIAVTGTGGGQLADASSFSFIVPSGDMQKIEDIHLILCHMLMKFLYDYFDNER